VEVLAGEPWLLRGRGRLLVATAVALVAAMALGWLLFRPDVGLLRDDHGVSQPGGPDDQGSFGMGMTSIAAGTYSIAGAIVVCLRAGVERAVIDEVTVESGGLIVTGVAVRPVRRGTVDGGPYGTLSDLGFSPGRTVTGQCADERYSDVGVQFAKPTAATARADGLVLHWHAGSRSGETRVQMHVVLCEGADLSVPECSDQPDTELPG
jgi:hypothetical protein